jgi:hypothetical protein
MNTEVEINITCDILDNTVCPVERDRLQSIIMELVESLNGDTIHLTIQ